MIFAAGTLDMGERSALYRLPQARHGQLWAVAPEVIEQRGLEFALDDRLAGVDDFQDPQRTVRTPSA